jgi:glycosyltransferase involved in cell wall biosynthesis
VAWNVRGADISAQEAHPATRWALRLNALLSRPLPARIVYCAHSAERIHVALGYDAAKGVCIHNGVDVTRFRPDPEARAAVRRELGIGEATPLVGLLARWNPQKDHPTFFRAADILMRRRPDVRFVLAGSGMDPTNAALAESVSALAEPGRISLLGLRRDVPAVTAALDLATSSSSWGEGFPNVIAEAMACGVPAVATDAGDAGEIINDTGRVVPRRDPEALATAWHELLSLSPLERAALGARARMRIEAKFALATAVERYAALYTELMEGG